MKTIKKRKEPTKVLTDKKKLAVPSTKGKIPFLKRCVGLYMDIRETFFLELISEMVYFSMPIFHFNNSILFKKH